jgi:hypothetical protein
VRCRSTDNPTPTTTKPAKPPGSTPPPSTRCPSTPLCGPQSEQRTRFAVRQIDPALNRFDYEDKDPSVVYPADPLLVQRGRDATKD